MKDSHPIRYGALRKVIIGQDQTAVEATIQEAAAEHPEAPPPEHPACGCGHPEERWTAWELKAIKEQKGHTCL